MVSDIVFRQKLNYRFKLSIGRWCEVNIIKLLVMKYTPASYLFLWFRYKCTLQNPVSENTEYSLMLVMPSFTPIQINE
jgi:hypothetical protein